MELRHLRYFAAVAEELNFRKASERLRVAQPALSSQIKDLEYELGVRLLDRDTGGVRLTDAGAAFLDEVRLILAHAQRAVTIAQEAAKGRRGRLTVGYFAPIFMGIMPASLKAFRDKFPDVEVTLVELPIADQLTALEEGTIQIGFTVAREAPLPPGLKNVEVARSPIRIVVGRGHRLARQSRISLADLQHEPLLCFTPKKGAVSVQGEIINRFFSARGLKIRPLRVIDGVEAFRATLESGPDLHIALHALWRADQASQLTANFIAVMLSVAPLGKKRS